MPEKKSQMTGELAWKRAEEQLRKAGWLADRRIWHWFGHKDHDATFSMYRHTENTVRVKADDKHVDMYVPVSVIVEVANACVVCEEKKAAARSELEETLRALGGT